MSTVPIIDDVDLSRATRLGANRDQMLIASVRVHVDERTTVTVAVDSPPLDDVSNEEVYMRVASKAKEVANQIAVCLTDNQTVAGSDLET